MSQKLSINDSTSFSASQPTTQTLLTTALVDNNSIPLIQNALLHELQASGWSTNLKTYITQLMRSGECTKYDDLMDRVLDEALRETNAAAVAAENGKKSNVDDEEEGVRPSLAVPNQAITQAVKIVKKELEKICQLDTA
jgi:hypothetical protein